MRVVTRQDGPGYRRERDFDLRSRVGREMLAEKAVTQEMRQLSFDNYQTTDDHGMQIYGIAEDQKGNRYYMVKKIRGAKPVFTMAFGMLQSHL